MPETKSPAEESEFIFQPSNLDDLLALDGALRAKYENLSEEKRTDVESSYKSESMRKNFTDDLERLKIVLEHFSGSSTELDKKAKSAGV